jgi:peroxiredoxin
MPELVALSHQYKEKGIRFIGIGVDSDQNVKNFLQKVKVDYPVFVSGYAGADLARNFGNTAGALPFTVVIDQTGKIRETKLGQIQPAELKKTLDVVTCANGRPHVRGVLQVDRRSFTGIREYFA